MSIVTRTGDQGKTGVIGGSRVSKDVPRLEAYGTVDELNAVIGVAAATSGIPAEIQKELTSISHWLFELGCDLATPGRTDDEAMLSATRIQEIEAWIDRDEKALPPLKQFILPGGHIASAQLHHARTVCRRAERRVVALHRDTGEAKTGLMFLNRLSDLLFIYARRSNQTNGVEDVTWNPEPPKPSSDSTST